MSTRTEKRFEDREAKLYLALEHILEEMSQSTRPQRKLADELGTLLVNHYEVYGGHHPETNGSVEIEVEVNPQNE